MVLHGRSDVRVIACAARYPHPPRPLSAQHYCHDEHALSKKKTHEYICHFRNLSQLNQKVAVHETKRISSFFLCGEDFAPFGLVTIASCWQSLSHVEI